MLEVSSLYGLNLRFLYPLFFTTTSLICSGGKQILYLPTKAECATFFWPSVVSEGNGHFLNSVVAVPRLADPFILKAAEFSVSALQPSQDCYDS
jgi:hypothetical protein